MPHEGIRHRARHLPGDVHVPGRVGAVGDVAAERDDSPSRWTAWSLDTSTGEGDHGVGRLARKAPTLLRRTGRGAPRHR